MRISAGTASAEIVEAVPNLARATSLDGHTFVPPKPLADSSPLPEGPAAGSGGGTGRVFLNVNVDVDGSTGVIEIVDAPRGDKTLSSAVVSALQQWKFRPAELDGEQVASRVLVVFEQR
jgi:TonB family protein